MGMPHGLGPKQKSLQTENPAMEFAYCPIVLWPGEPWFLVLQETSNTKRSGATEFWMQGMVQMKQAAASVQR